MLHVTESPFFSEDESEPLRQHYPEDPGLEDFTALMEKMAADQEQSTLESMSLNSSQEDKVSHFHVDPITGHIATVTLNPPHSAKLQPHADGM